MLQTLKTHFSYRWLAFLLIPAVILIAFFSANHFTTQAHAASPCSGSLISTKGITSNGTAIGELDVYYDSSTGKNCAITQAGGPSWGIKKEMTVSLAICHKTGPSWNCDPGVNVDPGNYYYYAGPVSLGARGQCIMAEGGIFWNGVLNATSTGPGFCGG